ncbi:hypothetical protein [Clostridium sp. 'White wine YQ']|uniref:hypothetical protein n=1 Tax=Clostridium sp. 'White wine YQ' TaxID=3027474 RepID=UPI002366B335|nr:hypothetical protein [Clostridium sp. 'White wine YQ']MDD7794418.1 hypothetical protein [Clostridium sp. 'White wine YQ']
MKRKVIPIISLVLIAAIVFTIYNGKNKLKVPTIENISSMKIIESSVGASPKKELAFDFSKKEHVDMANNILYWMKSGKIIDNTKDKVTNKGGNPTSLIIESKDGTKIQIEEATYDIETKVENGAQIEKQNANGQVKLFISNTKEPVRELSPSLSSFLNNGWKNFFKCN